MDEKSETLLTSTEAADLLGVTMQTVQLWVDKGILRAWKTPGGHRRIAQSSVDRLLKERQEALHGHGITLLVIEDDPDLMALYRKAVAGWEPPVQLFTAVNGFDGLILVGQTRPDLIVTDLVMPSMDGFQLVRTIRSKPEMDAIRILVVTVLSAEEIAARGGLPTGVTVFSKPLPLEALERLLRENVRALSTMRERPSGGFAQPEAPLGWPFAQPGRMP